MSMARCRLRVASLAASLTGKSGYIVLQREALRSKMSMATLAATRGHRVRRLVHLVIGVLQTIWNFRSMRGHGPVVRRETEHSDGVWDFRRTGQGLHSLAMW